MIGVMEIELVLKIMLDIITENMVLRLALLALKII